MGVLHGNPYGVLASFPINVIKTNTLTKVDQGEMIYFSSSSRVQYVMAQNHAAGARSYWSYDSRKSESEECLCSASLLLSSNQDPRPGNGAAQIFI